MSSKDKAQSRLISVMLEEAAGGAAPPDRSKAILEQLYDDMPRVPLQVIPPKQGSRGNRGMLYALIGGGAAVAALLVLLLAMNFSDDGTSPGADQPASAASGEEDDQVRDERNAPDRGERRRQSDRGTRNERKVTPLVTPLEVSFAPLARSEDFTWQAAERQGERGIQLDKGWVFLDPKAPPLFEDNHDLRVHDGRTLAVKNFDVSTDAGQRLETLMNQVNDRHPLGDEEKQRMRNPRNWKQLRDVGICVLAGGALLNGSPLLAQDSGDTAAKEDVVKSSEEKSSSHESSSSSGTNNDSGSVGNSGSAEELKAAALIGAKDADKNGSLSFEEFFPTAANAPEMARKAMADRFAEMDSNGDGELNQDELVVVLSKSSSGTDKVQGLKNHFKKLDADNNGFVTQTEFMAGMPGVTQAAADQFFTSADTDGDGQLSEQEYLATKSADIGDQIRKQFDMYDKNGDGQLTKDEFPIIGVDASIDADGDGSVSFEEFEKFIKEKVKSGDHSGSSDSSSDSSSSEDSSSSHKSSSSSESKSANDSSSAEDSSSSSDSSSSEDSSSSSDSKSAEDSDSNSSKSNDSSSNSNSQKSSSSQSSSSSSKKSGSGAKSSKGS